MPDSNSLLQALLAIGAIVDDENSAEQRLDGIRGVLARIGMLRVGLPAPNPTPRTPAEGRLEGILKAATRIYGPPSLTPPSPPDRPTKAGRYAPPRPKPKPLPQRQARKPEPKPLVNDPERQARIRREFDAAAKRMKKS